MLYGTIKDTGPPLLAVAKVVLPRTPLLVVGEVMAETPTGLVVVQVSPQPRVLVLGQKDD